MMFGGAPEPPGVTQVAQDVELAKRMLRGERRAFDEFCTEYLPKLFRYAARRLSSRADIDDVVQIVLTQAARRIETYRGESTLLTWLIGICRHEIGRHVGAAARRDHTLSFVSDDVLKAVVESLEAPIDDEPEHRARRHELISLIQVVLDQLPRRYADALELRYVNGLSSKEVAARLGIGDEGAQSLIARARRAFRELCTDALSSWQTMR